MNGWLVFFVLVTAYLGVLALLRRRPQPLPGGFEVNGPFIFWRTQFGKRALKRLSKYERFWNVVADIGIVATWIVGAAIFALLLYQLSLYFTAPDIVAESETPVEFLIGLPGINPLIPVWYGLAALVIALVIHEGSHGVMAYVGKMRVKSLGLLLFVIPIGAFVEPDEEDMEKAGTRAKNRVFAAGPSSNLVTAGVAGLLLTTLFLGNVALASDQGVGVGQVVEGGPAEGVGLQAGDIILGFRDVKLYDAVSANATAESGTSDNATGETVFVYNRTADFTVQNATHFTTILNQTRAGDNLTVVYQSAGTQGPIEADVTLADRYDFLVRQGVADPSEEHIGKGFLGMGSINLAFVHNVEGILEHPFQDGFPGSFNMGGANSAPGSFIFYISYPFVVFFTGIDILAPPYQDFLVVGGPLSDIPKPLFFGIATLLYWIIWINIMLGTFNALPAGPLDGGQMFKATLRERLMKRYQVDPKQLAIERQEMGGLTLRAADETTQNKLNRIQAIVSRATWTLGLFILALILLPIIGPRILGLFI